jgi:hypothetical protein
MTLDINAGDYFLGNWNKKNAQVNMWQILEEYTIMTDWNTEERVKIVENKSHKITEKHNTK